MTAKNPFFAIWKILSIQAGVVLVVAAIFTGFSGMPDARSALLGGMTAFVPNLLFAFRIAASRGKPAKQIVRAFYSGESIKLVITAGMFVMIFQMQEIRIFPLLSGYTAVLAVFWFGLLINERD